MTFGHPMDGSCAVLLGLSFIDNISLWLPLVALWVITKMKVKSGADFSNPNVTCFRFLLDAYALTAIPSVTFY